MGVRWIWSVQGCVRQSGRSQVSMGGKTHAVRFHVAHDGPDVHGAEHRAWAQLVRLVVEDVPVAEVRVVAGCTRHRILPADDVGGEECLALNLVILCLGTMRV